MRFLVLTLTLTLTILCLDPTLSLASGHHKTEYQPPAIPGPNDCIVSNWTDWSPCSGTCRGELVSPVKVRFRSVIQRYRLNGTRCPHLSEWKTCNDIATCTHCNCLLCNNTNVMPGSQTWCRCCESGLGSGCNCPHNSFNRNRCIDQGWGTTLCQGYLNPNVVRDYCHQHNYTEVPDWLSDKVVNKVLDKFHRRIVHETH